MTRVTQETVTATRKESLKGNVQSPLLFTPGKRGPLTQMQTHAIAEKEKKKNEKHGELKANERNIYVVSCIAMNL